MVRFSRFQKYLTSCLYRRFYLGTSWHHDLMSYHLTPLVPFCVYLDCRLTFLTYFFSVFLVAYTRSIILIVVLDWFGLYLDQLLVQVDQREVPVRISCLYLFRLVVAPWESQMYCNNNLWRFVHLCGTWNLPMLVLRRIHRVFCSRHLPGPDTSCHRGYCSC